MGKLGWSWSWSCLLCATSRKHVVDRDVDVKQKAEPTPDAVCEVSAAASPDDECSAATVGSAPLDLAISVDISVDISVGLDEDDDGCLYSDSDSDGLEYVAARPVPLHVTSSKAMSLGPIAIAASVASEFASVSRQRFDTLLSASVDSGFTRDLDRDVAKVREIGQGAFGHVYLGVHVPTLRLCAIKEVIVAEDEDNGERRERSVSLE